MLLCSFQCNIYSYHPELLQWKQQFKSLGFKASDIAKLYHIFICMLTDSPDYIYISLLLTNFHIDFTNLKYRVFTLFDYTTECIDFREFVICIWNICTLNPEALVYFCFDLLTRYRDHNQRRDVNSLIHELYGNQLQDKKTFQEVYKMVGLHPLHEFEPDDFYQFCKRHSTFISPLIRMQANIRSRCGGNMRWRRLSKYRMSVEGGQRVATVREILAFHVDGKREIIQKTDMLATSITDNADPKVVSDYPKQAVRRKKQPRTHGIAVDHTSTIALSKGSPVTPDMLHRAVLAAANSRVDSKHSKPHLHDRCPNSPSFNRPPLPKASSKSSMSVSTMSSVSTKSQDARVIHLSSKEHTQSEICLRVLGMNVSSDSDRENDEREFYEHHSDYACEPFHAAVSNVSSLTDFSFNGSHYGSHHGSLHGSAPASPARSIIQISKLSKLKIVSRDPGSAFNSPGSSLKLRRIKVVPICSEDYGV